ncbi:MAG: ATP-binding protein, partial [Candidatus Hydrogenedentota bacterium]
YSVQAMLARATRAASPLVQLDEMLEQVGKDIGETDGVRTVRILLLSETEPDQLVTEYSSEPMEKGAALKGFGELLHYMRQRPSPVALEEMIHGKPTPEHARVAHHLAELEAYLCVPLKSMADFVGLLTLGPKRSQDIFTTNDMAAFATLAGPLAAAIENARLYSKLEEANLHRARILASMRGGVLAVDTTGRVQTINQAASDLLGDIQPGSILADLPEQIAQVLARTLETHHDLEDYETQLLRPDGLEIPVAMSSACLTSSEGSLKGAMVMIYDLSPVKRLEQNVQRADRLSSIGTLAAGMAHEIKNPLVSVKTFTQLLPKRYADPEFRSTFAEVVLSAVERIDLIVSRLLDFARPQQASFAPRNICKIIQDVLMLTENQAIKAGITIKIDLSEPVFLVNCDEQQLHQVFLNLILNAIEAMGQTKGGVLRVSASIGRMQLPQERHRPLHDVESVVVSVQDTGSGIPEDQVEAIFNPFYTTKENGSGLGLSVVHGIVAEHGGTIDVESVPGHGTTFNVTFPMVREMASLGGEK